MAKPSRVRELLESSPRALGALIGVAALALVLVAVEQGSRIWARFRAAPQAPAMEIARLGRLLLVPVTPALQKVELVRNVQEIASAGRKQDFTRVPLWPVQLLVVNPGERALNLHACTMRLALPINAYKGVRLLGPLESSEYFFSDAIASADAKAAGKPIAVGPAETRRIQLYFLFAMLGDLQERADPSSSSGLSDPAVIQVGCRDEAGHELIARSTVYGNISAEPAKKQAKPKAK